MGMEEVGAQEVGSADTTGVGRDGRQKMMVRGKAKQDAHGKEKRDGEGRVRCWKRKKAWSVREQREKRRRREKERQGRQGRMAGKQKQ